MRLGAAHSVNFDVKEDRPCLRLPTMVDNSPGGPSETVKDNALPEGFFVPEESLPHAFSVVGTRVSVTLEKMYSELFGLTVVGWRLIAILGSHAPLSAKALGELTALDAVTISRALDQLSSKKMISRRTDPVDRRRAVLKLSKKGQETYQTILPLFHASENAIVSVLSKDEIKTLRGLMKRLVERSAAVLNEDCDWRQLLEQFGYASTAKSESSSET